MSGNSLKWIPLGGMELSAANTAAAEKLRRFGFAVMANEFGSEKLTKAGLCIYDVLAEKENPNILLITSNTELYGWYRILMTGIGADFKIITGVSNAVVFFSKGCPNLFLMSADALSKANGLKAKAENGFVWDLIVIDEEQSSSVPNYKFYKEQLPWKAEKLLITAPVPAKKAEDKADLTALIKSVLSDSALAAAADDIELDDNVSCLDSDNPVMRYFDTRVYDGSMKRNIIFRDYEFSESEINGLRRRMDLRSGLPVYKYGGNIYEDYDCDALKATYQKAIYTRSDVEDLRAFDKKLDSFIGLLEEIFADEKNRAIVYCCDKETVDYLRKVITCLYPGNKTLKTAKGELFSNEDIIRKLRVDDSTVYPRVVLGVDSLGAVGDALDRINYIVNYELPTSAVLLERRMTRHGSKNEADRKFVIFRDKNKLFDSRVLDKVLYGSIVSAFCEGMPSRNILLDIEDKGEHFANVFEDLKYVVGYAAEVDSCFDLIKKFKGDYSTFGTEKISNAKQLSEFADKLLERICTAFGLSKESSRDDAIAAINAFDGLCVMNGKKIEKVSADRLSAMSASFAKDDWKKLPFADEAVNGLAEAKKHIDELHSGDNFHLNIKNELSELGDSIQYPVLFGIWRYRVREQDSDRSFRDYIKIYNDGI
ncbi:MAG: hypothetical protein IJD85_06260 [Oscillospiraceae bacterium]|nr:hypothetical protein [Oscillospiraceae bacterium]